MNRRLALLTGGLAVGLAAVWRVVRRKHPGPVDSAAPVDARAGELRQRLDESRPVVDDREEFESAETTVDEAEAVPQQDPAERRRAVHEEGRSAVDRMRGSNGES